MDNFDKPFHLRKRFRHAEEAAFLRRTSGWNKTFVNLETGSFLGRTPSGWLKIVLFYISFYGAIILLFAFCYLIFDGTIKHKYPKWFLKQPGFSFEPALDSSAYDMKIEFHRGKDNDINRYVNHLEKSLSKYGDIPDNHFGPCISDNDFGYRDGQPCIFLKVNRVIGFTPVCIEEKYDLPQEAPRELFNYIRGLSKEERINRVWISCQSRPSFPIQYYPQRYISAPFLYVAEMKKHNASNEYINMYGQENAMFYSPTDFQRIVAVKLLKLMPNVEYKFVCFLWAKNIHRDLDGRFGAGLIRLKLLVKEDSESKFNED